MSRVTAQTISLWLAVVFGVVLLGAFLAFPGFFPPMSPNLAPDRVAAFFRDHRAMIRASLITFDLCGVMLIPLFMVVVHQMKRMATPTQVLAYCYLSAVAGGTALFALSDLLWLVAAFRPERDPQLVVLLNDFAWIIFTAPVGMTVGQNLCLALAIHLDRGPDPVLPRWVAHVSVLLAAAMGPAAAGAAVRTGPLAWDGVVSFWLRIAAYGANVVMLLVVLRRAVAAEARELAERPGRTDDQPVQAGRLTTSVAG